MNFFNQAGIERLERRNNRELKAAFETARNRKLLGRFDQPRLAPSGRMSLCAVNAYSRIWWGRIVCEQISRHLCPGNGTDQDRTVYFVTLVDINCATSVCDVEPKLTQFRKSLRRGLRGISHWGVIEPAYYANLQVGVRFQGKRCLFWHMHALAWGLSVRKMRKLIRKLEASGQYRAIAEGFKGAHSRRVKAGDLAKVTGYMLKSPCNAYRVARRDMIAPDGNPVVNADGEIQARFFQRKTKNLRPGERIRLFLAMKNLRLDQLSVAGGEGTKLLAEARRIALST
jgi:hypothetical protein